MPEASCSIALRWISLIAVGLTALALFPANSLAQEGTGDAEAWLVTYGPGEVYWQRFGHNAIWIRDAESGLDHVFNFGFFDFEQEGFLVRFVQGRMLYFSAARPAQREFTEYVNENRSIRAQRLNLKPEQLRRLTAHLLNEVQPENRDYLYDYYLDNCSTRVRDALDLAYGGLLQKDLKAVPAGQSFRDHTRRLSIRDYWLYLGLETVLGAPVDRPVSRWDELFIPGELADAMADAVFGKGDAQQPMVLEDVMLFSSTVAAPAARPGNWWPRYLLLGLAIIAAAWLACRLSKAVTPLSLARAWLLLAGLAGSAMAFFWFFTDHSAARLNLNLLLLNPLWLLFAFPGRYARAAGWALLFLSAVAVLMIWLPPWQYNLDVIAALLPLNLASAWTLLRPDVRKR